MMVSPLQICCSAIALSQSPVAASSSFICPPVTKLATPALVTRCSRMCQQAAIVSLAQSKPNIDVHSPIVRESDGDLKATEDGEESSGRISVVQVPRPRYISVSKSELLNAIVSTMFESQVKADQFIRLSKCLETILHAEHKSILEEMRVNYDLTNYVENNSPDLWNELVSSGKKSDAVIKKPLKTKSTDEGEVHMTEQEKPNHISGRHSQLGSSSDNDKKNSIKRASIYTHFQRSFVQLLYNAEFEELSVRDLLLTSALNTDYLLTLPINVDWKRAAESNAIIYRRGYTTEKQKGLLTVEKLDYLQSKLLQRLFLLIAKPLGNFGIWLAKVLGSTRQKHGKLVWEGIKLWLEKLPLFQKSYSYGEFTSTKEVGVDHLIECDLPIWLAAQRAVTRYEGILSAIGPRGRLLRKLLVWIGFSPSTTEQAFDLKSNTTGPDAESVSRKCWQECLCN